MNRWLVAKVHMNYNFTIDSSYKTLVAEADKSQYSLTRFQEISILTLPLKSKVLIEARLDKDLKLLEKTVYRVVFC